jgi:hypothetical protein
MKKQNLTSLRKTSNPDGGSKRTYNLRLDEDSSGTS